MAEMEPRNSAEFSRYVYEELKHVRIIHFSILVVTTAIAYVVIANWTPAVELHSELESFQSIARGLELHSLRKDPSVLLRVNPGKFDSILRHIQDALSSTMGSHVSIHQNAVAYLRDFFRLNNQDKVSLDSLEAKTIWMLRREIEGGEWYIDRIDGLFGDVEKQRKILIGRFDGRRNPTMLAYTVAMNSVPRDDIHRASGSMSVNLTVTSRGYFPDFPPLDLVDVDLAWTATVDTVRASKNWFHSSYPLIQRYWDSVSGMTLDSAMEWASIEETNMLAGHQFSFLGLSFDGKHIGFIGPAIVAILFIYLISYVLHIHKRVRIHAAARGPNVSGIAPWIGVMDNGISQTLSWITLVGASILGIALPSWRLAGVPFLYAEVVAVLGVFSSVCISMTSANLSHMYSNVRSVQSYKQRKTAKKRMKLYKEESA